MSKFLQEESEGSEQEQTGPSKFLQVEEDEQEDVQVKKEEPKKKENKKNKKNNKDSDDEIDKILDGQAPKVEELDEEAKKKADKKKEKKAKQAEKKKQETEQPPQQQQQQQQQVEKKVEKPGKPGKKPNAAALRALEMQKQKEEELKKIKEEQERLQREEEERLRKEQEEEERKKKEEEERRLIKQKIKEEKMKAGEFKTKKQLEEEKRNEKIREQLGIKPDEITNKSNVVRKNKKKPGQQQQEQVNQDVEFEKIIQEKQQIQEIKQQEPQQQNLIENKIEQLQQKQDQKVTQQIDQIEDVDDWEQLAEDTPEEIAKREKLQLEKQQAEEQRKKLEEAQIPQISNAKREILNMYKPVGDLRSPICCILGHVDTGKTTLLDKIRNTNVQEGEAGGITQQIGATFFPAKKLKEELIKTTSFFPVDCNIPGLLIIDTPGHESFTNLRTRGSSLADLAILVVDLMHGLENQTLESLELLRQRKTPFIIALNKIDRCVEWKQKKNASSYQQLLNQTKNCKMDYDTKKQQVFTQLAEKGFNVAFYWENEDPKSYISVVPTSGVTGEGIPDLLSVIVKYTSVYMRNKIKVKEQFNCTVLEKKVTEGHGTTLDCLLVDGQLKKDDKIVLAGFQGPIITKVRAILTPHPMKEMRVKGEYIYHDIIYASMGLKISAVGLEEAMAGSQMFLGNTQEDIDRASEIINGEMEEVKKYIKLAPQGVGVAASTLGSLEALLVFLNSQNIPVSYVSVGPVSKDDVMKALKNVLTEDVNRRKKEFACMLVFDIKVLPDAQKFAEENSIKVFEANIIYHLFDRFMEFVKSVKEERKKKEAADVVFPCQVKILKIINTKEPIILGLEVEQGVLKIGTPLCIYDQNSNKNKIGVVDTIELNHKSLKEARQATGGVAIRLGTNQSVAVAKLLSVETKLCSLMTRKAIDILKEHFREDMSLDDWQLVKDLKLFLQIP